MTFGTGSIVDLNLLEEQDKEAGGIPLEIDQILRCIKRISVKVVEITKSIINNHEIATCILKLKPVLIILVKQIINYTYIFIYPNTLQYIVI
ncbi:hypothetical protein U3516DRAFT_740267 [Neocallimastix sp. 'constans']